MSSERKSEKEQRWQFSARKYRNIAGWRLRGAKIVARSRDEEDAKRLKGRGRALTGKPKRPLCIRLPEREQRWAEVRVVSFVARGRARQSRPVDLYYY